MITCVFTLDYEVYGNGNGSLRELVLEPTQKLRSLFEQRNLRFVTFVEVAELEIIEANRADPAIGLVKDQIRELYRSGFEIGLHLHPQWYNGRHEDGVWLLDFAEYNLCTLPRSRIAQIVDRSIHYLRKVIDEPDFVPLSFRAGNWLFQPTQPAAEILASRGVKVDSSVFKGGLQHEHKLDYRSAPRKEYWWRFKEFADVVDLDGPLVEAPIFTQMVPFWKMLTGKRITIEHRAVSTGRKNGGRPSRLLDFLRFRYPMKLDFCRLSIEALMSMVNKVIEEDRKDQSSHKLLVAIGHTKDLVELQTVRHFLAFLEREGIKISTFREALMISVSTSDLPPVMSL